MKLAVLVLFPFLIFVGCKDASTDVTPPSPPQALSIFAGDNMVEVFWYPSQDQDVAGYNVYVSASANGRYSFVGTTKQTHFIDQGSTNGTTYYYTVSAYDRSGNESTLSGEIVHATPRPEGFNVTLPDYHQAPDVAGYDFSTYTIGPYNDQYTDVFFDQFNGSFYLDVWNDTNIQDFGYTSSLDDITQAPLAGWSPTKDVRVIAGHTYIVQTRSNHYAKLRIISVSLTNVVFDWAYQLQSGNFNLKTSASGGGSLSPGAGFISRR